MTNKRSGWAPLKRVIQPISLNNFMRLILIGLVLSILTTFMLQFAMYFQEWGRYNQTTDFGTALGYTWNFMWKPQAWFSVFETFLLYSFIMALLNRLFLSIALYGIIAIVAFVAEFMKVKARNEPIMFSDMSEAGAAGGLSGMVDRGLLIGAIVAVLILLVGAIWLEFWLRRRRAGHFAQGVMATLFQQTWSRIVVVLVAGGVLAIPFVSTADENQEWLQRFNYERVVYSSGDDALWNGPLMTFVSNVSTVIMREPAGYSKAKMAEIQKKYATYATELNKNRQANLAGQTVIYVLSESLANPNDVPSLTYSGKNVSKNMDKVKATATFSGKMLSSGYGGGTANIEHMTLTGMPLATYAPEMSVPYVQVVPFAKAVPNVTNVFQQKDVLHPFVGSLYNRTNAYKKMGIDGFYTTDNTQTPYPEKYQGAAKDGDYPTDANAYRFLTSKIDSAKSNQSQFLQLMTMQNHMPYTAGEYPNNHYKVKTPAVSKSTKKQIESYLEGVHRSDVALGKLIKRLDASERPITMVLYGDHWPGVFTFVDAQAAAKVAHETDYFVYQNPAAKKLAGKTPATTRAVASPSDFPALTFEATNTKVSPYFALQTAITKQMPAFANYTRNTFVNEQGKTVKEKQLTAKQQALLTDLKYVQYDLSAGKNYLGKQFLAVK